MSARMLLQMPLVKLENEGLNTFRSLEKYVWKIFKPFIKTRAGFKLLTYKLRTKRQDKIWSQGNLLMGIDNKPIRRYIISICLLTFCSLLSNTLFITKQNCKHFQISARLFSWHHIPYLHKCSYLYIIATSLIYYINGHCFKFATGHKKMSLSILTHLVY